MLQPLRFDLGGVGCNGERKTININAECDIKADFTELDSFCLDETVEEFYLCHALEHVPNTKFAKFLCDMHKKLRPGGSVRVVQSDIAATLRLWREGKLSFRSLRTVLFPPADRLRENPFHQHFNMWGPVELAEDFRACGFDPVKIIDAGTWQLDTTDDLHPGAVEAYHSIMIPNLGVVAIKPLIHHDLAEDALLRGSTESTYPLVAEIPPVSA